jgi:hypothetical protein
MTTKWPLLVKEIGAHYNGGLSDWEKRYAKLLARDRHCKKALHISASQLFRSHQLGHADALKILDKVIACKSAKPCFQILCPACRVKKQEEAGNKAVAEFAGYPGESLKLMTLLLSVEADPNKLKGLIADFRRSFNQALRNSRNNLDTATNKFKMIGAFEIDLKNIVTQWDAQPSSRKLIEGLGYDPKKGKRSQYLLHLHAVVGDLDERRKTHLRGVIEKALGKKLLPYQLHFKTLHAPTVTVSQDDNLRNLASYMFKARLQFADNIFDNNLMEKRAKYHAPYAGKELISYLSVVNDMQNFKGLKFNFGA